MQESMLGVLGRRGVHAEKKSMSHFQEHNDLLNQLPSFIYIKKGTLPFARNKLAVAIERLVTHKFHQRSTKREKPSTPNQEAHPNSPNH